MACTTVARCQVTRRQSGLCACSRLERPSIYSGACSTRFSDGRSGRPEVRAQPEGMARPRRRRALDRLRRLRCRRRISTRRSPQRRRSRSGRSLHRNELMRHDACLGTLAFDEPFPISPMWSRLPQPAPRAHAMRALLVVAPRDPTPYPCAVRARGRGESAWCPFSAAPTSLASSALQAFQHGQPRHDNSESRAESAPTKDA